MSIAPRLRFDRYERIWSARMFGYKRYKGEGRLANGKRKPLRKWHGTKREAVRYRDSVMERYERLRLCGKEIRHEESGDDGVLKAERSS